MRRPAVAPCVALLLGISFVPARIDPRAIAWSLPTWLALAGLARRRAPRLAQAMLCGAAAALGARAELLDRADQLARSAFLPAPGAALELEIDARLAALPQVGEPGVVWLELEGRPRIAGAPWGRELHLLLRVAMPVAGPALPADLLPGDRLRIWCRLARPRDGARQLDALGSVKNPRLVRRVESAGAGPLRAIARWKLAARGRLDAALGADSAVRALCGAMLIGDRAALSAEEQRPLVDAGALHLISISGLHVALVAGLVQGVLGRLRLGTTVRRWTALAFLAGFALFVGPVPCVMRAVLAAGLLVVVRSWGREGDSQNTLAWLAAVLALGEPDVVRDPSFQLTFLSTWGLLALGPELAEPLPLPRWLAVPLALSAGAYLASAPVVAWHFGRLAPLGIAINLVAVPLGGGLLLAGYALLALAAVPGCAAALAALCRLGAELLLVLPASVPAIGAAALRVPPPGLVLLAVDAAALLFLAARTSRRRTAWLLAATTTFLLHLGPPPSPATGRSEVALLDVGQGLAVLLRGPRGGYVLVDAGGRSPDRPDPGERVVLPYLARSGARRLEALVLTHEHVDHVGGARAILRQIEVGELWMQPGSWRDAQLRELAELARARGTALVLAERGHVAQRAGLSLAVLHPDRGSQSLGPNERSVVLLAGAAPARILIPGDLGATGERLLLDRRERIGAEALIVAHHGSRSSSTLEFLRQVQPRVAALSCGLGNPFGHPHRQALQRLHAVGAHVWRTDLDGLIRMTAGRTGWCVGPDPRQRGGNERQDEDGRQQQSDGAADRAEARAFVEQRRVPIAHPPQDDEPHQIRREVVAHEHLVGDQTEQGEWRQSRCPAVEAARQGIGDVTAVELAHREQVERGDQHADPRGSDEGVGLRHHLGSQACGKQIEQPRRSEGDPFGAGSLGEDRRLRPRQTPGRQRERHGESRQRSRGRHIEQSTSMRHAPAHADHGTERSDRWHAGNEER
ncbi:MAG TPA: DNA internalization-related competence protein ComEC/Rec2 [Candidatus Polarisedimenticolaceae bacterium]|nr:DNA internalization-related competence protein ComEC/Rec2 [Candidatus Polarisedimenticolaceae bacterium]